MSREFFKTNDTSTHRAINLRHDRRDPSQNLVPKDDKNRHVTHGTNTLNGEKVKHAGVQTSVSAGLERANATNDSPSPKRENLAQCN